MTTKTSTLQRFTFQPGNMSRYDLLFGRVPSSPMNAVVPSCTSSTNLDGGYLLVWLSRSHAGGVALRFDGHFVPCAGYMTEKMGKMLDGDANALLGFLRTQGIQTHIDGDHWTDCGQYMPLGGAAEFDAACNVVGIV
jgi:hypothetical protein